MPDVIYIFWPVTSRLLPSALVGCPLFTVALLDMRADGQIHPASSIKKAPSMPSAHTQLLPGARAYPGTSSPSVSARVGSPLAQLLSQIPTPHAEPGIRAQGEKRATLPTPCLPFSAARAALAVVRAVLWSFLPPRASRRAAHNAAALSSGTPQQPVARAASRRTCL